MSIDIDAIDPLAEAQENGLVVELLEPTTGKPNGATITMAGPDTRKARMARDKALRHVLAQVEGRDWTDDDEIEVKLRTTAGAALAWSGFAKGGKEAPCTFENVLKLFRGRPWFQAQCDRKASDRRNFIKS